MTKKLELYKCDICGNLVEILASGHGALVCCEKPMILIKTELTENEELNDKHIPVIEKVVDGFKIRIGATTHPMTKEHHIEFIQAISKDEKYIKTKFLTTEEIPELNAKCNSQTLWARALCNIHGLFKKEF